MTDKSNAELPAPAAGVVVELGGSVGDIVNVGELIAIIESADAPTSPTTPDPAQPSETPHAPAATSGRVDAPQVRIRPKAAPSTRRVAAERGIDLATVVGSGPGGRIVLSDLDQPAAGTGSAPQPAVEEPTHVAAEAANELKSTDTFSRFAKASASEPRSEPSSESPRIVTPPTSPATTHEPPVRAAVATPEPAARTTAAQGSVPLRGIRRVVARNMTQSWSQVPHIHAFEECDAEPLLALRASLRSSDEPVFAAITPLAFFVAATAKALVEHPQANASLDMAAETITQHSHVNIGIAVATDRGLVVPVLHAAETLTLAEITRSLATLVAGARNDSLAQANYRDGTVTITNFGALGGEQATPLIRPPESLIVGFGSIKQRPFVIEGHVVARHTLNLVAGADHRLLDGDTTTAILNAVAHQLAKPVNILL